MRQLNATELWKMHRVGQPEPNHDGHFAIVPVTTYDLRGPLASGMYP